MTFTVTCRGADGSLREEIVEAANRAECFAQCKLRGIVPVSVKEGAQKGRRQDGGSPCGRAGARPSRAAVGRGVSPSRGRRAAVERRPYQGRVGA